MYGASEQSVKNEHTSAGELVYNRYIIIRHHQSLAPQNSQEILLDIASNLVQIGRWTLKGFRQRETNIALYLKLTRKNVDALSGRDLGHVLQPTLEHFDREYRKLETQYRDGIGDHRVWAGDLQNLAADLVKRCEAV